MQSNLIRDVVCVVDSDVIIDYFREREYAQRLLNYLAEEGLIAVSTVTHFEIYQGIREGEELLVSNVLNGLLSIPVDTKIAQRAGTLYRVLRSKGLTIGIADAVIATTALDLNVPVVTNNVNHYPFAGLKIIRGRQSSGN